MPNIFSAKQIDHCHHLLTEHNMDFNQIADVMGTTIRNAHHLIRCVWQRYPKPRVIKQQPKKKYCSEAKFVYSSQEIVTPFKRPKAEYSNKRI